MTEQHQRRAVAYYRVSTLRQAQTGTQAEEFGGSIASQQAACHRFAAEHGLEIVAEYPEPGGSGTAIDRRPKFRQLLERVLHQQDVEVVLVYTRSRAFRNAYEAMVTREAFRKIGVELLSTQEPSEPGPEGDLVTLILDGVNEYHSRKLGADVAFKMAAKAARGGTPGRAKLGYRNTRAPIEGRSTAVIDIDPDRAPFIVTAFRLFATGQYTLSSLRDALAVAGLRSRPSKRHPAGSPISVTQVTKMLSDRTYLGYVVWCGEEYPGDHPALVDQELFDRAQRALADRCRGSRRRKWEHHLKGLLWCGRCSRRLILESSRNGHGWHYFYFLCSGRQPRTCDLPRLPIATVEAAIEAHWSTITIRPDEQEAITQYLTTAVQNQRATDNALRQRLRHERTRLSRLEDQCLELLGQPDWPVDKLTERLALVRQQRADLKIRFDEISDRTKNADTAQARALHLAERMNRPRALFRQLPGELRKTLAYLCHDKLHIDVEEPDTPDIGRLGFGVSRDAARRLAGTTRMRVVGDRRAELNTHAIADLIVTASQTETRPPKREHGRDVTVWELQALR